MDKKKQSTERYYDYEIKQRVLAKHSLLIHPGCIQYCQFLIPNCFIRSVTQSFVSIQGAIVEESCLQSHYILPEQVSVRVL